ncbi:hypothetical protein BJ508DRAFT_409912 [Ascobolus immersus RN42]|uniref:Calponin-homology (CH) domain-containing protein n=1 Tax=Ascobolus immersus RN42 TaxID=1160509 RepID=A0A3N4IUQ6_ASCIM|nr:hypothetical protein BJ508DRAFT_409912 [Ascobolus immersus RN42]
MASVSSLDKDLSRLRLSKYTPQEANEILQWICQVLQIPPPPGNTDLLDYLKDGVALCKLVNPVLNTPLKPRASKMPFVQMENIALFLTAVSQPPISLPPPDLFLTVDLFEKKDPAQVLQTLNAFSRVAYRLKPHVYKSPIGGPIGNLRSGAASPPPVGRSNTFSPTSPTRAPFPPQPVQRSETASSIENARFGKAKNVAPAWNVAQYGGPVAASQGLMGVSFGGIRQITSPGPAISSSREKDTRRRKEEEEERYRKAEEEMRKREEAQNRAQEEAFERRRLEEEQHRLQREEDDRLAREERRLAQLQEEARREEERVRELRRQKQLEEEAAEQVRREREERMRFEDTRGTRSREEEDYQATRESERLRIRELERELQKAREREQRYEQEREAARRAETEARRRENAAMVQQPIRTGESRPVPPLPSRTGPPVLPQRTGELRRDRADSLSARNQYVRSHRTGEREMVVQHRTGERDIIRIQRTGSPDSPLPPPSSSYPIREDVVIQSHRTGGSMRDQGREDERAFLQDAWGRYSQPGQESPDRSGTPVIVSPSQRALPTPPRRNNGPPNGQFRDPPRSSGDWGHLSQPAPVQSVVVPQQTSPVSPRKSRWGGSSFLERERERERQRQKEWEQEQLGREDGDYGQRSRGF